MSAGELFETQKTLTVRHPPERLRGTRRSSEPGTRRGVLKSPPPSGMWPPTMNGSRVAHGLGSARLSSNRRGNSHAPLGVLPSRMSIRTGWALARTTLTLVLASTACTTDRRADSIQPPDAEATDGADVFSDLRRRELQLPRPGFAPCSSGAMDAGDVAGAIHLSGIRKRDWVLGRRSRSSLEVPCTSFSRPSLGRSISSHPRVAAAVSRRFLSSAGGATGGPCSSVAVGWTARRGSASLSARNWTGSFGFRTDRGTTARHLSGCGVGRPMSGRGGASPSHICSYRRGGAPRCRWTGLRSLMRWSSSPSGSEVSQIPSILLADDSKAPREVLDSERSQRCQTAESCAKCTRTGSRDRRRSTERGYRGSRAADAPDTDGPVAPSHSARDCTA
jgi:hypothetical protein